MLLCLILRRCYISTKDRYYSLRSQIIVKELVDICVASSTIAFFSIFMDLSANSLIIWLVGVLLVIFISILRINSVVIMWPNDQCFWGRLFGLYHILKQKEYCFQDVIFLRGFSFDYFKSCDRGSFRLFNETNSIPIFVEAKPEDHNSALKRMIERMLESEIEECNNQYNYEILSLEKAQYLIEICHKTKTALGLLINLNTSSFMNEIYKYKLILTITSEKYMSEYKGREYIFLKTLNDGKRLKKMMRNQAKLLIKLWNQISLPQPEINVTESLILKILNIRSDVEKLSTKLIFENLITPELLTMYLHYLELLHGDYFNAKELRRL